MSGTSLTCTPIASATALPIAPIGPIAPASPMPLLPSGVSGLGVSMWLRVLDAPGGSDLRIRTEANLVGRLGQLGEPIVRGRADAIMGSFATSLAAAAAARGA